MGFSQSMNIAMRIAPTPWICALNDDVLFINDPFPGIAETFSRFENAAAVCPQSVKEPGWGWAEPGYRYLIPDGYDAPYVKKLYEKDRKHMEVVKEAKKRWEAERSNSAKSALDTAWGSYRLTQAEVEDEVLKLSYDADYINALVKEKNWAVVDGFAMFMPVFRADVLEEIGMFDLSSDNISKDANVVERTKETIIDYLLTYFPNVEENYMIQKFTYDKKLVYEFITDFCDTVLKVVVQFPKSFWHN